MQQFGTIFEVLFLVVLVIVQGLLVEIAGHQFVYKHEEYKDLTDKTRNLGTKIKVLKEQHMYG